LASGAFVADYDVPRGTQVDHLSTTTMAGVVYDFVRIVAGAHARATTYIRNLDLRDRGNGAATVDLPVPDVHVIDVGDLQLNEFVSGATPTPIPRGTRCVPNPGDTRTVRTPVELVLIRIEIANGPLNDIGFLGRVDGRVVAEVYAEALAKNYAGHANVWGLLWENDQPGPVGVRFLMLGEAAVPALRGLLDNETLVDWYAGSEEATIGNAAQYRVKDFAAYYLGDLLRRPIPFHRDLAGRDLEIAKLREALQAR
jgi:hypothetical protein